jgi:hypothetical protein
MADCKGVATPLYKLSATTGTPLDPMDATQYRSVAEQDASSQASKDEAERDRGAKGRG